MTSRQILLFGGMPLLAYQEEFIASPATTKAIFGGYGSGKTLTACLALALNAFRNPWRSEYGRNVPYSLIVGLDWSVIEGSSMAALRQIIPEALILREHGTKRYWDLVGGHRIYFKSVANNSRIEGSSACGVLVDEAHQVPADRWPNIINRLRDPLARHKLMVVAGLPVVGILQDQFDRPEHREDRTRLTMFVSTDQNTSLLEADKARIRSTIGAEDIDTLWRGRWRTASEGCFPSYNESLHVVPDHGDMQQLHKSQPVAAIGLDCGHQSVALVIQRMPKRYRVEVRNGTDVIVAEDGERYHVADEIILDNESVETICRRIQARGWRVDKSTWICVDPATAKDQTDSIRRVFPGAQISQKTRGQWGYAVNEGIRCLSAALRDANDKVKLTFSRELPRTKRSVLTAIPRTVWAKQGRGENAFKDNTSDHAVDALRVAMVRLLPLKSSQFAVL